MARGFEAALRHLPQGVKGVREAEAHCMLHAGDAKFKGAARPQACQRHIRHPPLKEPTLGVPRGGRDAETRLDDHEAEGARGRHGTHGDFKGAASEMLLTQPDAQSILAGRRTYVTDGVCAVAVVGDDRLAAARAGDDHDPGRPADGQRLAQGAPGQQCELRGLVGIGSL